MSEVLVSVATGLYVVDVVAYLLSYISRRSYDGLMSVAAGIFTICGVYTHNQLGALINGAMCAYWGYLWWNGGGGDDTKRRLRRLAHKFKPVRRTAPQVG